VFVGVKWLYTSFATLAHNSLPAFSWRHVLSALSLVSTHTATMPPGVWIRPASVRASLTEPSLCATTVPGGRKRGNLSLSLLLRKCASRHCLIGGRNVSAAWIVPMMPAISRAVVEPRPYFLVRSGSTDVVLPRKTLALILVLA